MEQYGTDWNGNSEVGKMRSQARVNSVKSTIQIKVLSATLVESSTNPANSWRSCHVMPSPKYSKIKLVLSRFKWIYIPPTRPGFQSESVGL